MTEPSGHSLNQTLARNLRLIYAMRRQNLEEFSSELGVGHTTVQNIFRHKSNLTLDTVELIAKHLEISPVELLSEQYPKTDLVCSTLILETLDLFQPLPPSKRKQAAALFCQLLELLPVRDGEERCPAQQDAEKAESASPGPASDPDFFEGGRRRRGQTQ